MNSSTLESRIADIGSSLVHTLGNVLESIPGNPQGPAELSRAIGIDKVLASRILKAMRNQDPIAAIHWSPGPEPLKRMLKAVSRHDIPKDRIKAAEVAVDAFASLIRQEAGDRSALEAMIAAWVPEARTEFELRRKQAAFRAMSELKGSAANVNLGTVFLHPSDDEVNLDVVWLLGLYGFTRFRPGTPVKFATRRFAQETNPRLPSTLDGIPVDGLDGLRLNDFSSQPSPELDVQKIGEAVHYSLGDNGFGPKSAVDMVFAEVNMAEMARYVPKGVRRKRHVFAEVSVPVKTLLFDALIHKDVYTGSEPQLVIYDTALDGVADVNDPSRDVNRFDLYESIQSLGSGIAKFRTTDVPRYAELLRHACDKLGWNGEDFRGYRCRIDYPPYGSQVVMAWDAIHKED